VWSDPAAAKFAPGGLEVARWRDWRRDGPTLAGWVLAGVVFGLVDRRYPRL
jgi:hypothetical protein